MEQGDGHGSTPPPEAGPGPDGRATPFLPPEWQESPAVSPPAGAGANGHEAAASGGYGEGSPGPLTPYGATTVSTAPPPPDSGPDAVPVWAPVSPVPVAPPAAPVRRGPRWTWAVVSLVAALVGAVVGGFIVASTNHTNSETVKEISSGPALLNGTTDVQAVIDKVLPAVVSIDARSTVSTPSLFGGATTQQEEDQGTGMIISSTGEVITNNHVISGATRVTVTLWGKTTSMPATLVDTDPTDDVALLQITGASNLPTVSYGDSDNVQVGDAVVAIGNALGLSAGSPTVTQGIISATGRTVQAGDSSGNSTETLTNMFQTDAAINPGNSGGPLVDSAGKVIGMNTAVASSSDGTSQAQNIGFAIPSNKIGQLLPSLRDRSIGNQSSSGTAFLGVSLETLTSALRSQYNFVPTQGAVVLQVEGGSPAAVAGLQQGDVITTFDGKAVTGADQLATAIQSKKPGTSVRIGLYRGEAQLTVTATLASSSTSTGS